MTSGVTLSVAISEASKTKDKKSKLVKKVKVRKVPKKDEEAPSVKEQDDDERPNFDSQEISPEPESVENRTLVQTGKLETFSPSDVDLSALSLEEARLATTDKVIILSFTHCTHTYRMKLIFSLKWSWLHDF